MQAQWGPGRLGTHGPLMGQQLLRDTRNMWRNVSCLRPVKGAASKVTCCVIQFIQHPAKAKLQGQKTDPWVQGAEGGEGLNVKRQQEEIC